MQYLMHALHEFVCVCQCVQMCGRGFQLPTSTTTFPNPLHDPAPLHSIEPPYAADIFASL